jgi:hypothetical protein
MGNTTSKGGGAGHAPAPARITDTATASRAAERAALKAKLARLSIAEIKRDYKDSLDFSELLKIGKRPLRLAGYIYARDGSAYCDFCDEELVHDDSKATTGYKVHISISTLSFPLAWNNIWPILLKNNVKQFKALLSAGQAGKEIVIYLMNDPKTAAIWSLIFSEIEGVLVSIEPNPETDAPKLRYLAPTGVAGKEIDHFGAQEPRVTGGRHFFYTDDSKKGTREHDGRPHPPDITPGMMADIAITASAGAGTAIGSAFGAAMAPVSAGIVAGTGTVSGGSPAPVASVSLAARPSLAASAPAPISAPFASAAAGGAGASAGPAPAMPMGPPGPIPSAARPMLGVWFAASQASTKKAETKSLLDKGSESSDG